MRFQVEGGVAAQTQEHDAPVFGPCLVDQEILDLVDPDILSREVEIACGAHRSDTAFPTITRSFGHFLVGMLGRFRVGEKDGLCILSGGLEVPDGCQRTKKKAVRNHLMMFDYDCGAATECLLERCEALGYFAVVYTTINHLKTVTEVAGTKITEWLQDEKQSTDAHGDITVEQAREYLRQKTKIVPEIIASVTRVVRIEVPVVNTKGESIVKAKYRIAHDPMPRCRLILLLDKPFAFDVEGVSRETRYAEWEAKYKAVAEKIGATIDSSCTDPTRLMYTPVKAPDALPGMHEWYVVPGAMIDLDEIETPAPHVRKRAANDNKDVSRRRQLKTPNLQAFLNKHADDFEAADWMMSIASDDMRNDKGDRVIFRCPNEDGHSDPDPNDQGFVVWNASQREEGHGFHMLCMHDTCKTASHDKRAWYLDLACQKYGVADAMELREFCPCWEAEQEAERKQRGDLDALIAALSSDAKDAEINAVVRLIAALPSSDAKAALSIDAVRTKVPRLTKRQIEDMVRAVRRQMCEEARANDTGHARQQGAIYADDDLSTRVERVKELLSVDGKKKTPRVFARAADLAPARLVAHNTTFTEMHERAWSHELREIGLEQGVTFRRVSANGDDREVSPHKDLVDDIMGHAGGELGLPEIKRVVHVPIFAPDGTLLTEAGYNAALGVYLNTTTAFRPVPDVPNDIELGEALWWLHEFILDFPLSDNFTSDPEHELPQYTGSLDDDGYRVPNWDRGRSSRINFFGLLTQPIIREMIKGPCPAYWINKPTPGTGASWLLDLAYVILRGKATEADTRDPGKDLEEFEKRWTAAMLSADDIIGFDNAEFAIKSGSVASNLTTGTARIRPYQTTNEISVPIRQLIMFTGNGLTMEPQLMRRVVPINLDARMENPAKGRDFKYDDPKGWALENRSDLVWSLHVLVKNWIAQGSPRNTVPRGELLGSFEDYHRTMHGIFKCAGLDGFLSKHNAFMMTRNEEGNEPARFVQHLVSTYLKNESEKVFNSTGDLLHEALDHTALSGKVGGEPTFAFDLGVNGKDMSSAAKSFGHIVGNWRHPFAVVRPGGGSAKVQIVRRKSGNNPTWVLSYVDK